ncbi:DUF4232 domain-containing protein [Rhodococcus sp. P1Y]|uniref:DUF4232 domain-containing protein n=1 Tax=Rhodococcus sp. P1Y TaxID=1302308 RepID=UPI000EB3BC9D|nr:DUF4232 domain-containing protein [Rhodococcus sp. P1Y]AYJ49834.1 DUF4232 domain-containing protein [Rhodococcus sp. P1Y]
MNRSGTFGSVLAVGLIAVSAACASEDVTVSPPSQETPSAASTTSNANTNTAESSAAGAPSNTPSPQNCLAAQLTVTLGAANGAAGSTELPILFSNTGTSQCTLDGYPGVSYVSSPGGAQVGQAAVRSGSEMTPVELAPAASASALVKATVVGNYPADQCEPTPVAGLNIYSPNTTEAVYLPYPTTGCGTSDTSITQLAVQPVTASQ